MSKPKPKPEGIRAIIDLGIPYNGQEISGFLSRCTEIAHEFCERIQSSGFGFGIRDMQTVVLYEDNLPTKNELEEIRKDALEAVVDYLGDDAREEAYASGYFESEEGFQVFEDENGEWHYDDLTGEGLLNETEKTG